MTRVWFVAHDTCMAISVLVATDTCIAISVLVGLEEGLHITQ